jgi:hypothetical protein
MRNRQTTSSVSRAGRVVLTVLLLLAGLGGVAYAIRDVRGIGGTKHFFAIRTTPTQITLVAGARARVRITLSRFSDGSAGRFEGPITLSLARPLPRGVSWSFGPNRTHGASSTLTLRTSADTPAHHYSLLVRARGRGHRAAVLLKLHIAPLRGERFTVGGRLRVPLIPGSSVAVDLWLTNAHAFPLWITAVAVRVRAIRAPNADAGKQCTPSDFGGTRSRGRPLRLPAFSSRSLSALGMSAASWPRLEMINRSVNQDGCKGAALTLGYNGTARR